MTYGHLCTEFYNADKEFAPQDELVLYLKLFTKENLILEPMCGSGRLLIPLFKLGYKIEGFDNSPAMLESCRHRAKDFNLIPTVYQADVEDFVAAKSYHGIIIPLGSFQLLYPREKSLSALKKFYQWLSPNGKLVMDLFIPWEAMYEHGETDKSSRTIKVTNNESIQLEVITAANKYQQYMHSNLNYTKYVKNKMTLEEKEEMDIVWYYPNEIQLLLEKYNFTKIKIVDRFLNGSQHFTVIASK